MCYSLPPFFHENLRQLKIRNNHPRKKTNTSNMPFPKITMIPSLNLAFAILTHKNTISNKLC
jgi:hypothetical protein